MRAVARRIARRASVSILEDLGIQQAPHSTLNSYLEKLLFLLTGNFGKPGRHEHPHRHRESRRRLPRATRETPVSGERIIIGLMPGQRRSPTRSSTDDPRSPARDDRRELEPRALAGRLAAHARGARARSTCVVVFDIAMTETARLADYVLPSPSQFEKWEASFFCLEFPQNAFQLRRPDPRPRRPACCPSREIHRAARARGRRARRRSTSTRCAPPPSAAAAEFARRAVRPRRRAAGAAPRCCR